MNGAAARRDDTRGRRGPAGQLTVTAVVLRRSDFKETSRIVTCLSREHGRITGLAKGAHRPDSPFLGCIDFLNEVEATFSADRGGLRLLTRAVLRHERRALREPRRFVASSHLAQLCDWAMPEMRPEPELHDLLVGGLNLLERCPEAVIPQVVLGIELRYLHQLGALPDLDHCSDGGCDLEGGAFRGHDGPGLLCRRHAATPRHAVATEVLDALRLLCRTPGRGWPGLQLPAEAARCAPLPALWLHAATEQRPRLRALVFAPRTP